MKAFFISKVGYSRRCTVEDSFLREFCPRGPGEFQEGLGSKERAAGHKLRWLRFEVGASSFPPVLLHPRGSSWETAGWGITTQVSAAHSQQQLSTVFMARAYKSQATPGP